MFKSKIKNTPQNNDSPGNYINDSKRLLQNGTTSLSIPEPSQ